ncbi:MAG: prolyl-tRNA editing enzyme YbaK/EbsC (Cys-tRNA(Pro) deacylase) [Gammaproteobacteria bacterium]|jgi:prolyl-tRNA editing enzyme YbaK/EbsC (Cys-tRNA(Pro) deacylase)
MIPHKVKKILLENNLEALEFEAGSTPTSEMAAAKIDCEVGQIAKSMLFKGKDGLFRLIVCPGDKRVDNKKLKNALGVKARFATVEETADQTGFKPGGVCPFGLEGLPILIDQSLARFEVIYPAAGNDASAVTVGFDQLTKLIGAEVCDVMG